MHFLALATDYDGTIAHHGIVDARTIQALERFARTGRRLIMVTGRELPELKKVFPHLGMFERVVAENGALIYEPATERERVIAPAPPPAFVEALRARGVEPMSVGRCIVATWEPHERVAIEVIRDMGLELQIIFNKGAVMILPPGMNKAAGLAVALQELGLSAANVVGVGDAENDHAFLLSCGCSAAVANALPTVKEECDIRLDNHHGAGVVELLEMICEDDARIVTPRRHGLLVGKNRAEAEIYLASHRGSVLIAGSSGIGKSTLATALSERMCEKNLQFCVFDPEGDYSELEGAVCVGDATNPPSVTESVELLTKLTANVVVSTQGLRIPERPAFFARLLPQVLSLRARTGRPHWLILDEAHQLLATTREDVTQILPEKLPGTIFITVHPEAMSPIALRKIEYVLALGPEAMKVIGTFCDAAGIARPPEVPAPKEDEILVWMRSGGAAQHVKALRPTQARKRHTRKYAEGTLPSHVSFWFRGPGNRLNLRAQNLMIFAQLAEGVDDETWEHHRRLGDYSGWFKRVIKDDELSQEAAAAEGDASLDAAESRRRIVEAVYRRYTAPSRDVSERGL